MCPNAQGMADGEGFPDRSVAAQARDSLYSRGHLRRRQVELAEGNVELPVFLLAPPPHYDNYDGVRVCGCRAEALCSLVIIILILLPSGPQRLQVFEENSCTSYPLSPPWYIHPGVLGGELLGMLRNLLLGYKMESVKTDRSKWSERNTTQSLRQ